MGREERINEEYDKKDEKSYQGGEFRPLFLSDFPEWRSPEGKKMPKEGDNFVKILPPKQDDIAFGMDLWAHWNVGDNNDTYICSKKMREVLITQLGRTAEELPEEIKDGKCPICEAQASMIKDLGGESYKGNRSIIDLFPTARKIFMIVDDANDDSRELGVQIWSAPMTKVHKEQIMPLCKIKKGKRAGEIVDISLPENEYTVCFTRKGMTREGTSYGGFSLEPSDLTVDETYDAIEKLPEKFEDILNFATYDEIAEASDPQEKGEETPKRSRSESERNENKEEEVEKPKRSRRDEAKEEEEEPEVSEFISSGSTLLNLALAGKVEGGWRLGRICNVVGDKSTGKTLLAIEAATFVLKVLGKKVKVKVIYDETEAAFDLPYAKSLGMPVDDVEFRHTITVEEFFNGLEELIKQNDYDLLLYINDSLDGLSSIQEMKAKIEDGSYNMSKQKKLGELFRKLAGKIRKKNICIMIISQVRDNIGVMFGPKQRRSGGKALDFYASQVVWLANKGKIGEVDRPEGVNIKAKVDKNKIWKPYREATFPILFDYGIDDIGSMVDFLIEKKIIEKSGHRYLWKDKKMYREDLIIELEKCGEEVVKLTEDTWNALEEKCKVVRKPKY